MHNSSMNDYTHMSDDELRSTYEAMGTRLMW